METKQGLSLQDVPFTQDVLKKILRSVGSYAGAGINFSITEFDGKSLTVVVEQVKLVNGFILNNKQLYDRASEVFKDCGFKVKIKPMVYTLNVDKINVRWIEGKMEEFGLTNKDLIKQLAIDKTTLSLILSATREIPKSVRSTFFYYFLTYELNRDFRQ